MEISPLGPMISPEFKPDLTPPSPVRSDLEKTDKGAATFSQFLDQMLNAQTKAKDVGEKFALGKSQNIHETMIQMQKADISFSLMVSVRNKLLEAYQTIMRMR